MWIVRDSYKTTQITRYINVLRKTHLNTSAAAHNNYTIVCNADTVRREWSDMADHQQYISARSFYSLGPNHETTKRRVIRRISTYGHGYYNIISYSISILFQYN